MRRVVFRLWRLGEARRLAGALPNARDILNRAVQMSATMEDRSLHWRCQTSLGFLEHVSGSPEKARVCYEAVVRESEDMPVVVPWAQVLLAVVCVEDRQAANAAIWSSRALDDVHRVSPELVEEQTIRALACVITGDLTTPEETFARLPRFGCVYLAHDARLVLERLRAAPAWSANERGLIKLMESLEAPSPAHGETEP